MSLSPLRRWLCYSAILVFTALFAAPLIAAASAQEIAARSLLGEAEKLVECALPQEALPVLDRVQTDYPGTEAAAYADLRRAQCFFFLKRYDDAVATATAAVTANPGTLLACWSQCILGQVLVDRGQVAVGISELKKVEGMLPERSDLGPLNEAREVLGRVCLSYLADRTDDLDAVEFLGWSRSNSGAKAKVLAILAAYRARKGNMDAARTTLSRLKTECPSESTENSLGRSRGSSVRG